MLYSVLAVISSCIAIGLCSLYFDSNRFARGLVFSFVSFCCFCTLVLGVLSIFSIGFSLEMYLLLTLSFSILIAFLFHKNNSFNNETLAFYRVSFRNKLLNKDNLLDSLFLTVLFIIAAVFGVKQFGSSFDVTYLTSDPANHFNASISVMNGGLLRGQFLGYFINGLILKIALPSCGYWNLVHIYCFTEVIHLFVSGAALYSLLRYIFNGYAFVYFIFAVFYMLGYPLNNMLFGFSYLGISITVVACILFFCVRVQNCGSLANLGFLSLSLYGLIISYSLFVPAIYLGVFIWLGWHLHSKGFKTKHVAKNIVLLFAIPVLLGFFVVYLSLFGSEGSTSAANALTIEGYIYRDLYGSFIIIAPWALFGFVTYCKERDFLIPIVGGVFIIFSMALLFMGILGHASSYYFFKVHYLLWLLFYILAAKAVDQVLSLQPFVFVSWSLVYSLLFIFAFSGFDIKLNEKRPLFNQTPTASASFKIYEFNFSSLGQYPLLSEKGLDAIEKASEISANREVKILMPDSLTYWAKALLNSTQDVFWWHTDFESILSVYRDSDAILLKDDYSSLSTSDGANLQDLIAALKASSEFATYDLGDNFVLLLKR